MTIKVSGSVVGIVGHAPDDPSRSVDLGDAAHLHSAVIQLLLALRPPIRGTPSAEFLRSYVMPLLDPEVGSA